MRGNLNLFSGERHYQTNFFSRFSSSKAEDAYSKDVQSRSRYPLLVLQIFDIMRLIYCYFIFSCGDPSQSQCNHTFLAIISLLSLFLSIVLVKKKNFSFYLMRLLLLLGTFWSNLLTLENINPISFWFVMLILSGIHNIFLINVWTISIQFQILETFFLMSYMYFFDKILFRELFDTFYLGIILILSYGLLSFGFERVQLERWVLYDSFKRSYRSLEILLSDFTFPVFIIDCNGKIIFHNQRAVNLVDEENNYLGGHFCDIFKDDTKKEIKSTIKKTWQTGVENRMLSLENHKNAEGNKINSTDNIIYEINSKQINWKGVKCILMVFTEQKFFQTSNSITNKFEEPCLSVFLSIILEIDLLNDYNYRPTPIFKEKIQNCGSLLFWNRIVQNYFKNNFRKIDRSALLDCFFNLSDLLQGTLQQFKQKTISKFEIQLLFDEKSNFKIYYCPHAILEIILQLIQFVEEQSPNSKLSIKIYLENKKFNELESKILRTEFLICEALEVAKNINLANKLEELLKIKKMKVQIISELEINEFKRIILPLLIQVSETKFTITCEEEMTKKTTNLTLTTPMPDDNLSNYPFVGEEGLFIKRQYISTEEEILDCSRKKSVKSRVLDTEILNKKEDNLGLLKKKRNRPNSMEKEIISSKLVLISNVIDINLKIKKTIIEIPPLQIPLNDMIGKSSSREMIVEKVGKTRFNNLLPSTNLFEEKTIRSSEILIEEELKKYFGHFRDGFKETIEQILNNIVEENENINEKKKIIFPSKQYLFNVKEEEETSSPKINSVKKKVNTLNQGLNTEIMVKNIVSHSSGFFTESNKTDSIGNSFDNNNDKDKEEEEFSEQKSIQTQSNKITPRKIFEISEKKNIFRSPTIQISKIDEKHIISIGQTFSKYLKRTSQILNTNLQENYNFSNEQNKNNLEMKSEVNLTSKRSHSHHSSGIYKTKKTRNIRMLTYARKWYTLKTSNKLLPICEICCNVPFRDDPTKFNFPLIKIDQSLPKKKNILNRPIFKKNTSLNAYFEMDPKLRKTTSNSFVFNSKKNNQLLPKKIRKKIEGLHYRDKITILAYDSEPKIKDVSKCKAIKCLSLRIGHNYNFEITNSGNMLMENYKKNIKNGYLYHMIILEIDMPEINGLWCAQKIRSYEQRYELKQSCIILLINENQTDFDNYSNLGVDHFVDLPINVKRLEDVIEIKLKEINKKNEKIEEKPKSNQIEYFKGFNINKTPTLKEIITLLAIDDNNFILLGMSNMKIKHKYKMDICKSGKLGIEKYKLTLQENHIYHIIFVDIEMPEMNGIEFTKIIRDFEKKSMLPKSYICGLITEEDTKFESFLEAGMDEFIKKPVNPSAMNDLIDRILVLKKDKKDNKLLESPNISPQKKQLEKLDILPKNIKYSEQFRFLAIDDNDFILIGLSALNNKLSQTFKMDIARSGVQGLEKYKILLKEEYYYHCLFIDIEMPIMNGLDLTKEIRKIETEYNLKKTLICGLITDETKDFDNYIEAGMNDFIKKPVNAKSMESFLQKIIDKFNNEKNLEEKKENSPEKKNDITNPDIAKQMVKELEFKPIITFLTVDDNDFILIGMCGLKLSFPFKMEICKSGKICLEKFEKMYSEGFLYHIIFMDIDMPILNGLETTKKIREIENKYFFKKTHIVGLINNDFKDVESYLEYGMNEFINKPVNAISLEEIVKNRMQFILKEHNQILSEIKTQKILIIDKIEENKNFGKQNEYKIDVFENINFLPEITLYDFIIISVNNPKYLEYYNGYLKKIKNLRIYAITTSEDKEIENYKKLGFKEILKKPYDIKLIEYLIKISHEHKQNENEIMLKEKDLKIIKNLTFPSQMTILVVDDNDFILMGMSSMKLKIPIKVDISKTADMAIDKYKKMISQNLMYHIIFMDIDMPKKNGLECTIEIREIEKNEGLIPTHIIGLVNDDYKDIDNYMACGMNEFINKPVNIKSMSFTVEKRMNEIIEQNKKTEIKPEIILEKKNIVEKKLGFNEIVTMMAVDDNNFILIGISNIKISTKYKMELCSTGKMGIEKYSAMLAKNLNYHIIFIDIDMPIMNGVELTKEIRKIEEENKIINKVHICGLTTSDNKDVDFYMEAGMNEFLNKPVNPKLFDAIVQNIIKNLEIENNISSSKITKIEYPHPEEIKKEIKTKLNEKLTFLAVDDNDFILIQFSSIKLSQPSKMDACKNGKIAFEKYEEMLSKNLRYHCIFMDIDMPVLNGIEATKLIREKEKQHNIDKTYICGLINENFNDVDYYISIGMDLFINKPVNAKILNEFVNELYNLDNKQFHLKINPSFLIVDENSIQENFNFNMDFCETDSEGLVKYRNSLLNFEVYHAILIDQEKIGLIHSIRNLEKEKNLNVKNLIYIISSSKEKDIDKKIFKDIEYDEFLSKPIKKEDFERIIVKRNK